MSSGGPAIILGRQVPARYLLAFCGSNKESLKRAVSDLIHTKILLAVPPT